MISKGFHFSSKIEKNKGDRNFNDTCRSPKPLCYLLNHLWNKYQNIYTLTLLEEPDMKSPKNQQLRKIRERVCLTKVVEQTLGLLRYPY